MADTLEGHQAPEASNPVFLMSMQHRDKAKAALNGLIAYDPTVIKNPA